MSFYLNAINGGNTIGPLICGFIITGLSWRWHKWIAFILTFINFLVVLCFCPETRYARSGVRTISVTEGVSETSSSEDVTAADKEATVNAQELGEVDQVPKKTFRQNLSLWSGTPTDTNLFKLFIRPLPLIVYPAVILSFLGFAVSLAWVVAINILNPFVLQAPPYNWKPDINGLINIAGLIGNVIGAWLGGWVVDKYSDWRSKKNNGVFHPETRLHLLIIPTLIVPAGCLAFGYGVAKELNWTAL
jgi:MFS family permease